MTVEDYVALPRVKADVRLVYGQAPDHFGDLYLPTGPSPHPVVVLIHGGCWQAAYDLGPLGSLCDALRLRGLAVWSIEYRRLGAGGGWPNTFLDVAAAVDFLSTISDAHGLDINRIVAVGHSAGGHLALWLAVRRQLPSGSPLYREATMSLAGIVSLAGIPDLVAAASQAICGDACHALVGGSPAEVASRYAEGSPAERLPLAIPHHHIVGALDRIVPPQFVGRFVQRAAKMDAVAIDVLPRVGHFEVVVPAGPCWRALISAIRALLGDPAVGRFQRES